MNPHKSQFRMYTILEKRKRTCMLVSLLVSFSSINYTLSKLKNKETQDIFTESLSYRVLMPLYYRIINSFLMPHLSISRILSQLGFQVRIDSRLRYRKQIIIFLDTFCRIFPTMLFYTIINFIHTRKCHKTIFFP